MARALAAVCLLGLGLGLAACASTSGSRCREQISDCIERCEATTGPRGSEPARTSLPPQRTMTECELRCGCKDGDEPPPSDEPGHKPTPTGM